MEDLESLFLEDFLIEEENIDGDVSNVNSQSINDDPEKMDRTQNVNGSYSIRAERRKNPKIKGLENDSTPTMGERSNVNATSTPGEEDEKGKRKSICESHESATNNDNKIKNNNSKKNKSYWKKNERILSKQEVRTLVA